MGEGFKIADFFFSPSIKGDLWLSIFVPSLLFVLGPLCFHFLLLITHFSQENYAHVLFIIPRAVIISQSLFLIHEQND